MTVSTVFLTKFSFARDKITKIDYPVVEEKESERPCMVLGHNLVPLVFSPTQDFFVFWYV